MRTPHACSHFVVYCWGLRAVLQTRLTQPFFLFCLFPSNGIESTLWICCSIFSWFRLRRCCSCSFLFARYFVAIFSVVNHSPHTSTKRDYCVTFIRIFRKAEFPIPLSRAMSAIVPPTLNANVKLYFHQIYAPPQRGRCTDRVYTRTLHISYDIYESVFPRFVHCLAWHLFVLVLCAIRWYTCTGCNRLEYLSLSPFSQPLGQSHGTLTIFSVSSPGSFAPCIVHQATSAQKSKIPNHFWFGFMKRHAHYFGHCFVLLSINFSFVVQLRLILMLNSPPMNSWRSIRLSEYCCCIFQMLQTSVRGQLISPWELFMVSHSNKKNRWKIV